MPSSRPFYPGLYCLDPGKVLLEVPGALEWA